MRLYYCASLLALILVLAGCSLGSNPVSFGDRIQPDWEPGSEWSVRVTAWPERARNPYASSAPKVQREWTYRVLDSSPVRDGYRVTATNDTQTYLLDFNEFYNLQSVLEVIDRRNGVWKTRTLHGSPTGGGAFLIPNWKPSRALFLPHPDLALVDSFTRNNFTSGGRSTGNWMVQRVREDGALRFELQHEPTKTRAVLRWEPGQPWWSEARYFYRERLVMIARSGS